MFGEFPYTNFHELNLDWIIKIAKDFLDQYTNIQQTITQGLEDLDTKAQQLQALLDAWYAEHSQDIADQLADALQDLNDWYTEHQGYLDQYLTDSITAFNTAADEKAAETIASIPDDYTTLSNNVTDLQKKALQIDNEQFSNGAVKNNILDRFQIGGGVLDNKLLTADETVPNTAWRINGATATSSSYIYYKYTQENAVTAGNILVISGYSWAAVWPFYAFYDANDNLLQYEAAVSTAESMTNAIVIVPANAAYLIVNGNAAISHLPTVYKIATGDLYNLISTAFKPSGFTIDANTSYTSVTDLRNNYIYLFDAGGVAAISDLPDGVSSYCVMLKIRPSLSHTTDSENSYYLLFSFDKAWLGVSLNNKTTWTDLTPINADMMKFIINGLSYIDPITSPYTAGAVHRNGTINTQYAAYIHCEYNVSALQNKSVLISGYSYATAYPLFVVFDDQNTVIDYMSAPNQGTKYNYYQYKIPENAAKIFVNGNNASTADYHYPSMQIAAGSPTTTEQLHKNKRRILFIGDSYAEGYNPDGSVPGWCAKCVDYMQLATDEYVILYRGGARFSLYDSSNTFSALIKTVSYPFDYFTDIVACGGFNDSAQTEVNIMGGLQNFIELCHNRYPLAKVHIGEIGYCKAGSYPDWQTRKTAIETIVIPCYQRCTEFNAYYLNNVEYWVNDDSLSNTDGVHPTAEGNQIIAKAVSNAIVTGSAPLPYNSDLRLPV